METESMEQWENPVSYWRKRSRQALESQGVVLPAPKVPLPAPLSVVTSSMEEWSDQQTREELENRRRRYWPLSMVSSRLRIANVGLDLICGSCREHISRSQKLMMSCHLYKSDPSISVWGSRHRPLTRCFLRCPNCNNRLSLGRNVGDSDRFRVCHGATQHFPPEDSILDNEFNHEMKSYPDALLISPNEIDDADGDNVSPEEAAEVLSQAAAYHSFLSLKGW